MDFTWTTNMTESITERHDFGTIDRRGRRIGAVVRQHECDFAPAPPDANSGYKIEPGHYFALCCHNTRDGRGYGASQPTRYFKTAEERQAALDKYLQAARKRFASERRIET